LDTSNVYASSPRETATRTNQTNWVGADRGSPAAYHTPPATASPPPTAAPSFTFSFITPPRLPAASPLPRSAGRG
jgi:hypothetical protein